MKLRDALKYEAWSGVLNEVRTSQEDLERFVLAVTEYASQFKKQKRDPAIIQYEAMGEYERHIDSAFLEPAERDEYAQIRYPDKFAAKLKIISAKAETSYCNPVLQGIDAEFGIYVHAKPKKAHKVLKCLGRRGLADSRVFAERFDIKAMSNHIAQNTSEDISPQYDLVALTVEEKTGKKVLEELDFCVKKGYLLQSAQPLAVKVMPGVGIAQRAFDKEGTEMDEFQDLIYSLAGAGIEKILKEDTFSPELFLGQFKELIKSRGRDAERIHVFEN